MSLSIRNGLAFEYGRKFLGMFAGCLREEEHRDAFEESYRLVLKLLSEYDEKLERRARQINPNPSQN